MRAHTSLRTAFRIGMTAAAVAGVSFAAADARADVSPGGDSGAPNASVAGGTLHYEQLTGLDTSISIDKSYSAGFFGKVLTVSFGAGIKLAPVPNAGPLFTIDMPKGVNLEASWAGDKKIVLKTLPGGSTDGTISVRHTLLPSLRAGFKGFDIDVGFDYDATKIINKIPGANFNYDSQATQTFAPWGFGKIDTKVPASNVGNAELFSMPLDALTELLPGDIKGSIGLAAVTSPTFSYSTTKAALSGADGQIANAAGEVVMAVPSNGDFGNAIDTTVQVEGTMTITGDIELTPNIVVTHVNGDDFDATFDIKAWSVPYTASVPNIMYKAVTFHLPLPNVKAPTKGVDLGNVKAGGSTSKTITISNTGEKTAQYTLSSSNSQFSIPSGSMTIPPGGSSDFQVKFVADGAGSALAEITVSSNDPDSPEQMFKIGANGADVSMPDDEDASLPDPGLTNTGCGCKTTGTSSELPSYAGLGLAGLAAAVFGRRRRSRN